MRLAAALVVLCGCAAAQRPAAALVPTLRERSAPIAANAKGDVRELYQKVAPSTVIVRGRRGYGTGIVIDPRGFILTNHHVIADAETVDWKLRVHVELGALNARGYMEKLPQTYVAWVLKSDPAVDLAVLKLDAPPPGLHAVELSKDDPTPGEPVASLGHGGIGLLWAVRDGEVMSIGKLGTSSAGIAAYMSDCVGDAECARNKAAAEAAAAQLTAKMPALVIQSSCQLAHGDSGGPLVNRAGKLVGVNAFLRAESGTAAYFHVHVAEVRSFLEQVPAEPVMSAPSPHALAKHGRSRRLDTDKDGKPETTVWEVEGGWVVFAELEPGLTMAVSSVDGHTAVWLGNRLSVENVRGSGRGTAWELTDGAPPKKLADDAPLVDRTKLSKVAEARFAWVDEEALYPVGLAINQPIDLPPDPFKAREWELFDYDGDGKNECGTSGSVVIIDPKEQLTEPIAKAPLALMRQLGRIWYFIGDATHATEDPWSGAVTSGPARGQLATALMTAGATPEETQRIRASLGGLAPRVRTAGAVWPDPYRDVGTDVKADDSGVQGAKLAAVSIVGTDASAMLFELDLENVADSRAEMEQRARKGEGFDLAWVKRSKTEWFLYDTDRDGEFDVMIFKPPSGVVEGFRRKGGVIDRDAELDGPTAVRALVFPDLQRRVALTALAKEFFHPAVIAP
ncbi:MAG: trypsin-like peptidase domain-containing protein [Myxococcaceae bacterium]|nr:trypsin-like peptidase domain-containing protein [Myxococcaceae bacterium]